MAMEKYRPPPNKKRDTLGSYALVSLTQGQCALIDAEDYDRVTTRTWCAHKKNGKWRVLSRQGGGQVWLHRLVLGPPEGVLVDHVNGNGLDNRKENLRIVDNAQNLWNRGPQRNNTSGYKGVTWSKRARKWMARIWVRGVNHHIGSFDSAEDAARAYNAAATEFHSGFAYVNPVKGA